MKKPGCAGVCQRYTSTNEVRGGNDEVEEVTGGFPWQPVVEDGFGSLCVVETAGGELLLQIGRLIVSLRPIP